MKKPLHRWLLALCVPLFVACPHETPTAVAEVAMKLVYPTAPKGDVVDTYFGTPVADPYRWLEDPDAPETRTWIDAENAVTQGYLGTIAAREPIRARLEKLWNYERFGLPFEKGDTTFYFRNDGLQNQAVLYVKDGGEARVLLDPNALSADGTMSLSETSASEDGKLLAYGVSDGGSDWSTWRIRDVATGKDLPDELKWIKFSAAEWSHDGKGFYYARYAEPANPLEQVNLNQKLYYHALGQDQAADKLIYERPDHPEWGFGAEVTEDGSTLVIAIWEGTEQKNRIFVQDLRKPDAPVVPLLDAFDAQYTLIGKQGDELFFTTDNAAPQGKVIAVNINKPKPEFWRVVIPETSDRLEGVMFVGGQLIAGWLHDAHGVAKAYGLDGAFIRDIALPGLGTFSGFGGRQDDPSTFYAFTGFTAPTSIYKYDVATGKSELYFAPKVDFDSDQFVTEQVFYPSKDGTKIPMFLVHKKGLTKTGANPVQLYGYGGFDISMTPAFSVASVVWMEMGGIYAVANLRGGGEYGREWHEAGTLDRKQNVFDDFIAAGEYLISEGWTSKDKLAIRGGSNGGLLVGACITQRPDLFAAAIPQVGVLDMTRYHLFTIGWAWASDYGTVADEKMFHYLMGYSPLHNVKPGTAYPATMVTTGDHDDRVVPAHSFKFAAALQAAQAGDKPVLIRIETRAGHGAGKSTRMLIDETADIQAFLVKSLNMQGLSE